MIHMQVYISVSSAKTVALCFDCYTFRLVMAGLKAGTEIRAGRREFRVSRIRCSLLSPVLKQNLSRLGLQASGFLGMATTQKHGGYWRLLMSLSSSSSSFLQTSTDSEVITYKQETSCTISIQDQ